MNSAEVHQIFQREGLGFEEIADGVVGAILLEFVGGVDGGGEIAGIDLGEDGLRGGGDVLCGGCGCEKTERERAGERLSGAGELLALELGWPGGCWIV